MNKASIMTMSKTNMKSAIASLFETYIDIVKKVDFKEHFFASLHD